MKKNLILQPILKWAGGKRQLLSQIEKYFPKKMTAYYEPFIGGGAVLFHLQPKNAVINDYNKDLINCYVTIKENLEELILELKKYQDKNNSEDFYKIRAVDRTEGYNKWTNVQKTARMIYLNRTCYNGLFRLNSAGQFNSPFGGYKNPVICNEPLLRAMNKYFNDNNITFKTGDFYDACKDAPEGSFIYLDPPYDQFEEQTNFVGYTEIGFSRKDQERLKNMCDELIARRCYVVISNSKTKFIQQLFSDKTKYSIKTVNARRNINSDSKKRGEIEEVLIVGKFSNEE
ncbi:MAG: Dam family site-specific DNA-(adenine-N6)-methyltransferase [Bacilli bacterium]|nr:Dam family site-specific DNA-(adenine-N6)-methyltransferase [Bacilli bacterium]